MKIASRRTASLLTAMLAAILVAAVLTPLAAYATQSRNCYNWTADPCLNPNPPCQIASTIPTYYCKRLCFTGETGCCSWTNLQIIWQQPCACSSAQENIDATFNPGQACMLAGQPLPCLSEGLNGTCQ